MTGTDSFAEGSTVSTAHCPACGSDVPAGTFCGFCGASLSAQRRGGRDRLRLGTYAAAPGEGVLRPALVSSLFPHLPRRSRAPFRVGLVVLLVVLVGCAVLRWQAPMIATAAFGLPVLFVIYLYESGARRDIPVRDAVLAAIVGIALGVGWAWIAGFVFADGYGAALVIQTGVGHTLLYALAIPLGEALLMLVPALVVRLLGESTRESLDGFLIGALGATAFTVAATLTLLAPQLPTGLVARERSLGGLIVEAGIQGVAMPLASVAVGGIFGVALWFTRPANASHRKRGPVFAAALVVGVLFVASGLLDISPFPNSLYLGGYLLIAVLALLALRIALQAALLYEAHDDPRLDEQLPCAECDHVVPWMAFCPNCGLATRARVPGSSQTAGPARRGSHARVLLTLGAGVGVVALVAVGVSMLISPAAEHYVCPPDCGRPPLGIPVETNPRFTPESGAFSVSYPGPGTAYKATFRPDGVVLDFAAGDTGTLALLGDPARDRTPEQIVKGLLKDKYPDATVAYEIPNASVGYHPGYGVVADSYPQNSTGRYTRLRVLIMVAVKHDYALIAAAVGPYHRFSPDFGTGHPSGANLELAMDMGKYVNSFQWRGDRYGTRCPVTNDVVSQDC
jgi:hypothetical protein